MNDNSNLDNIDTNYNERLKHLDEKIEFQEKIISEQQAQLEQLEDEYKYYSDSFNEIQNAFFWKITKPIRSFLTLLLYLRKHRINVVTIHKVISCLKTNGIKATWLKLTSAVNNAGAIDTVAKKDLFTKSELEEQRKHEFPKEIKFSIIVPLYNTPETFLKEMIESVIAQTYANWELCMADGSDKEHTYVGNICLEYAKQDNRIIYKKLDKNYGISGNSNACLEIASGDYIALFDHDDLLHPAALYEIMRAICDKNADYVYTDEAMFYKTPKDVYLQHFKPAYAPDNLLSNNYICHFSAFKKSLLESSGVFDPICDGSQDHDLILRLTEKAECIAHIPEVLYYWRAHKGSTAAGTGIKNYAVTAGIKALEKCLERKGIKGKVSAVKPDSSIFRIRHSIEGEPKVSIIIPNCEHLEELKKCLNSIFNKTTYQNYEIIIVENNSTSPEVFSYYKKIQKDKNNVKIAVYSGKFNYSAINNFAYKHCSGEYLLLLNNDTEVITPDWIEEMLMFAQREDVGAVGAKLYYPDGRIQHGGFILNLGGIVGHSHNKSEHECLGYMGKLIYAQNVSAVSSACMMIRRNVWEKMNGFDEDYAVSLSDVDFCMRLRANGYLIVFTPFAELYHCESKSLLITEELRFRKRWKKELEAGDLYYNPNFTLQRSDYSLNPIVQKYDARIVKRGE